SLEKMIQVEEVYKLIKENKEQAIIKLSNQIAILESISFGLKEIMPITSQAIINLIRENKKPENPLFKR
ncbi:MAG: hypothetical protein ORN26_02520, partial [Candidatus Pacebacteria bacterium]|nr:hypothetical protein [Candidatus Paceibacterota bacterium]